MKSKEPKYKITASVICADVMDLEKELLLVKKGLADYLHFDIMDGMFVSRYGLYPEMLSSIKKKIDLPIEVHMMVENPEPYIKQLAETGASIISVHVESCPQLNRVIQSIRQSGIKAGVALNSATPLHVLDYILDDVDLVILMGINPGVVVGRKLIPATMQKISDLKTKLANYPDVMIQVDGGVTFESAPEMISRGADMLVCGNSTIFKPGLKVDQQIRKLRKIIDKNLQRFNYGKNIKI